MNDLHQQLNRENSIPSCTIYTISNRHGMTATITNYGARILSLLVQDQDGLHRDVIVGYKTIEEMVRHAPNYYGAVVGRFANRIAGGRFNLDGIDYQLNLNNGKNHLHGGVEGFHQAHWEVLSHEASSIRLSCFSKNMDEGYPGNLSVTVEYQLNDDHELIISYTAKTDQKTVINLTNHAYFNLSGNSEHSIEDHSLKINANRYLEIDETGIPLGQNSVENSAFDFRQFKQIGAQIYDQDPQLQMTNGYDHCYILNKENEVLQEVASIYQKQSGIIMHVLTTEPGLQLYCGHFSESTGTRNAFCLETQHFPDSPNRTDFPTTILYPGKKYHSKTIYRFSVLQNNE